MFKSSLLKYRSLEKPDQRKLLFSGALVLITLLSYIPATFGKFIWDDDMLIIYNPLLRTFDGLRSIWFEPGAMFQYYPITHTLLWLQFQLFGLDPMPYHLTNISLHAINSVLIWKILSKLKISGAFLTAILFAVHPVHVESVAWISELKNVLSGLFYLISLLYAVEYWQFGSTNKDNNERKYYFLSLFFYICALHSKTVTFSLPIIILLINWWKKGVCSWRKLSFQLIPYLLFGLVMGLLTSNLEKSHVGAQGDQWVYSISEKMIIASKIIWFYLSKLLIPHNLMFIYPKWVINSASLPQFIPVIALTILFFILIIGKFKYKNGILLALVFFIITLFPALGFFNVFPMRFSFVADHFQYLASIGPLALIGCLLSNVINDLKKLKMFAYILPTLWAALLAIICWQQCWIYRDFISLWEDTLSKNPNCQMAILNYASTLQAMGNQKEAIFYYEKSTHFKPIDAIAYLNTGNYHMRHDDYDSAISEYIKGIEIDPQDVRMSFLYNNLGFALQEKGRYVEAMQCYYKSMKIDGMNPLPIQNIIKLESEGKLKNVAPNFPEILRYDPSFKLQS